jgi:hypothetical protein
MRHSRQTRPLQMRCARLAELGGQGCLLESLARLDLGHVGGRDLALFVAEVVAEPRSSVLARSLVEVGATEQRNDAETSCSEVRPSR